MKILILGAGMMGRAIAFDLNRYSNFINIQLLEKDEKTIQSAKKFLGNKKIEFIKMNLKDTDSIKKLFKKQDIAISAVPYKYNFLLAKLAIETNTHFLDLGGNNDVVQMELGLFKKAEKNNVVIIPDCGLAPGLTSIITRDIVEYMDTIKHVKIRVGGLPLKPKPPLNYQIVFSPTGLINEYVEDSIVLDHGKIIYKKSLTELETIIFPKPFGKMEAFLTHGGCSTLPYTYRDKIEYLDYKTIRYPGHCKLFKTLLSLGLADENEIKIGNQKIIPRDVLTTLLLKNLPKNEEDVVLLKVIGQGIKNKINQRIEYTIIDYYNKDNNITAMMRTTAYPTSIIAQMIEKGSIYKYGVFCPHEIVSCKPFFDELKKRNIIINKNLTSV